MRVFLSVQNTSCTVARWMDGQWQAKVRSKKPSLTNAEYEGHKDLVGF